MLAGDNFVTRLLGLGGTEDLVRTLDGLAGSNREEDWWKKYSLRDATLGDVAGVDPADNTPSFVSLEPEFCLYLVKGPEYCSLISRDWRESEILVSL